jgi:transcriptional regulator with XRE-family HTH domain
MTDTNILIMRLHAKKLGVLIYNSRIVSHRTVDECASFLGIDVQQFKNYEKGISSPSLPELEALAYFLNFPIDHYWGNQIQPTDNLASFQSSENLRQDLRNRIIATKLRMARKNADISFKQLAKASSIPTSQIKSYEMAKQPIPLPELEILGSILELPIEGFLDNIGRIIAWRNEQEVYQRFSKLPPSIQTFITNPDNLQYVEILIKMSKIPEDKLREITEKVLTEAKDDGQ